MSVPLLRNRLVTLLAILSGTLWLQPCSAVQSSLLQSIELPPGFTISVFAEIPYARSLALGAEGTVFVGSRSDDKVYALRDYDLDGISDQTWLLASGLDTPNGVAFYQGDLYIAENSRILRLNKIESQLDRPPRLETVYDDLPEYTHHGWKFIAFGPDNRLYIPIGAPCNVCESSDAARIISIKPDGSDPKIHAEGVRNSVGFAWHPETEEMWFTDNGRDNLGDDLPPDELNHAPEPGMHFGFPYCHGGNIPDPDFDSFECSDFSPPAIKLGPHVASLGMRFYTGTQFPKRYQNQIFIAEHGSWNRSIPIGYRISLVSLKNDRAIAYETFAAGWLQGRQAWGRPVDVLVMADGAFLVSDDKQGLIYRISYQD